MAPVVRRLAFKDDPAWINLLDDGPAMFKGCLQSAFMIFKKLREEKQASGGAQKNETNQGKVRFDG